MDHINIFNPYRNKQNNHEDELTRNFLILVKNIPLVQIMFFEMVKDEVEKNKTVNLESIQKGNLFIEEVHTQLTNNNDLFSSPQVEGRNLLSIIISDDKLETEVSVENSDRAARYDGVILCDPSWLFIIENKPSRDNIWVQQLNPNIKAKEINVIKEPCCLSWRNIIAGLTAYIKNEMLHGIEKILIEDFIEYVDFEYPWINPYTTFEICKSNKYLLNKRCRTALQFWNKEGKVEHHQGWKDYIDSGYNTVKQIALDAEMEENGAEWTINLWMFAGDTMRSAKEIFSVADPDKLLNLQNMGYHISKNFHLAYRSSNLLWFNGKLDLSDYVKYWKKEHGSLRQLKIGEVPTKINQLLNDGIIQEEDIALIQERILSKRYDHINICPGIVFRYSWTSKRAIELDRKDLFNQDFKEKVQTVLNLFNK